MIDIEYLHKTEIGLERLGQMYQLSIYHKFTFRASIAYWHMAGSAW